MAKLPNFREKKPPKVSSMKPKTSGSVPKSKLEVKVHLVEQEIKFAQALAGHDPKNQAKVLKNLRKWLSLRSKSSYPFTDKDFLRLWKGLFYAMWMSDKPLVQEQLAEDLGGLLHLFPTPEISLQFYAVFLQTINREWFGIDQWRIDKFLMLVRRVTRQCLVILRDNGWRLELIKVFRKAFKEHIFDETRMSVGLAMHFVDLYLEEVAKVSQGSMKKATVTSLIRPFVTLVGTLTDTRVTSSIVKNIFNNLLQQSDLGRQHREKYEAWKSFGFPTSSIDDLELVEEEESELSEAEPEEGADEEDSADPEKVALDPRAGRVNVILPELKFNPKAILGALEKLLYAADTKSKARKRIKRIMENYEKFAEGTYPLGVHTMPRLQDEKAKAPSIDEKITEMVNFEKELLNPTKLLKSLTKGQRRRFMKSGLSIEEFVAQLEPKPTQSVLPEVNGMNGDSDDAVPEAKRRKKRPEKALKRKITSPKFTEEPQDEWQEPLKDGEYEYFVPSMKKRLEELNKESQDTVINPFALKKAKKSAKKAKLVDATPSSSAKKKVRIALEMNTSQDTAEYLRQVRNSPQIPYDSDRKPAKSLLKPNLIPGPINPYYKRKINFD
ncbi:ribosomal RNA processing protein 1 homolog [Lutzomyia longipalpis]|uniref:ribosomal RNA processing protein 1 homolog n=1 Tax=Lutzomyia longipalpis TaxID=7200 RepID=UPI002483991D|nr:ribosomal RNA processing protein 1 homolog [Lutzomyia longipalpis]